MVLNNLTSKHKAPISRNSWDAQSDQTTLFDIRDQARDNLDDLLPIRSLSPGMLERLTSIAYASNDAVSGTRLMTSKEAVHELALWYAGNTSLSEGETINHFESVADFAETYGDPTMRDFLKQSFYELPEHIQASFRSIADVYNSLPAVLKYGAPASIVLIPAIAACGGGPDAAPPAPEIPPDPTKVVQEPPEPTKVAIQKPTVGVPQPPAEAPTAVPPEPTKVPTTAPTAVPTMAATTAPPTPIADTPTPIPDPYAVAKAYNSGLTNPLQIASLTAQHRV